MIQRYTSVALIILILGSLLLGCTSNQYENEVETFIEARMAKKLEQTPTEVPTANQLNIIYIPKQKNDAFLQTLGENLKKILAGQDVLLEVEAPTNQDQLAMEQIAIIEEAILSKVDGIVLVPADDKSLINVLSKVQQANIPVVIVDSAIDAEEAKKANLEVIPFITIDNEVAAYSVAKNFTKDVDTPSNALILTGDQNSLNARQRMQGAIKALEENTNYTIVNTIDGKWKRDSGYNIAKESFEKEPTINTVICGNDGMALGVLQYLEEASLSNITLIGFDAMDEAVEAVKNGKMTATVLQDPSNFASAAADTILKLIEGNSVDDTIIVETQIVQ